MNPKIAAIKNKISDVGKKVVNAGGDYIANRLMVKPSIDRMNGQLADQARQQVLKRRALNNQTDLTETQ